MAEGLVWTNLRDENSRGTRSEGPPQKCEVHLEEHHQVCTVDTGEKFLVLPSGGGKRIHSETDGERHTMLT